jgi:tetratricopeptide (TPR) repeat protein
VLVGHDRPRREVILHSGDQRAQRLPWETFEHTWARAEHWSALLLRPGDLPLPRSADAATLEQAALDFDRVASMADALVVWQRLAERDASRPVAALGASNRLVEAGRLDEAAARLRLALAARPGAALANNLAHVEARRGHTAEAGAALELAHALAREAAAAGQPHWLAVVQDSARELGWTLNASPVR